MSSTTGPLGCANGILLIQKNRRTALAATLDVAGRDQQNQILYLMKDPDTQIWSLDRTENEPYRESGTRIFLFDKHIYNHHSHPGLVRSLSHSTPSAIQTALLHTTFNL